MSPTESSDAWLPPHQQHVIFTLSQVYLHIEQVGRLVIEYSASGALELREDDLGSETVTRVTRVAPIPEAVSRYFADALTQLRAVLEHALFAEVQHRMGRPLDEEEERSLEIPIALTAANFDRWLRHGVRGRLPPFDAGSELVDRVRQIQPFVVEEPRTHPLYLLRGHTNRAKHRASVITGTILSSVQEGEGEDAIELSGEFDRPVVVGDEVARTPKGIQRVISVWAPVWVQRGDESSWRIAMHELRDLEVWVREVALPIVICGSPDVPALPPGVDTMRGFDSFAEAMKTRHTRTAHDRSMLRIQAAVSRKELPKMLTRAGVQLPIEHRVTLRQARAYVEELGDEAVSDLMDSLNFGEPTPLSTLQFGARLAEVLRSIRDASGATRCEG